MVSPGLAINWNSPISVKPAPGTTFSSFLTAKKPTVALLTLAKLPSGTVQDSALAAAVANWTIAPEPLAPVVSMPSSCAIDQKTEFCVPEKVRVTTPGDGAPALAP